MGRPKHEKRSVGHEVTNDTLAYQVEKVEEAIKIAGGVRSLARMMDCSASHITNIRKGKGILGGAFALKVAKYLGHKKCKIELMRPDLF